MVTQDAYVAFKLPSTMKNDLEMISEAYKLPVSRYIRSRLIPIMKNDYQAIIERNREGAGK